MEQSKLDSFITRLAPKRKKVQETFSSLQRLKRLNHVMLLHIHKQRIDDLDLMILPN